MKHPNDPNLNSVIARTHYVFVGDSETIGSLSKAVKDLESADTPYIESDYGHRYIGCLILAFGGTPDLEQCDGEFSRLEINGDVLSLEIVSQFCDSLYLQEIMERLYPTIKCFYFIESKRAGLFQTNDQDGKYFPQRVAVAFDDGKSESVKYFSAYHEAVQWIHANFGIVIRKRKDIRDFETELQKQNPMCYFNFEEFDIV